MLHGLMAAAIGAAAVGGAPAPLARPPAHAATHSPAAEAAAGGPTRAPDAGAAEDHLAPHTATAGPARAIPAPALEEDPDSGIELLGHPAPDWSFTRWIRTPPLDPAALRGKVVLLRWWTEGCHFCATTLPVVEALSRRHAGDGLVVIGVFHPKPPRAVSDQHVLALARKLGYSGPIAVDERWSTLDRYWLDGHPDRNWTSVSFLIDRKGDIVWVHGGGEYHPNDDPRHARCAVQYRELERALAEALAEPVPRP